MDKQVWKSPPCTKVCDIISDGAVWQFLCLYQSDLPIFTPASQTHGPGLQRWQSKLCLNFSFRSLLWFSNFSPLTHSRGNTMSGFQERLALQTNDSSIMFSQNWSIWIHSMSVLWHSLRQRSNSSNQMFWLCSSCCLLGKNWLIKVNYEFVLLCSFNWHVYLCLLHTAHIILIIVCRLNATTGCLKVDLK